MVEQKDGSINFEAELMEKGALEINPDSYFQDQVAFYANILFRRVSSPEDARVSLRTFDSIVDHEERMLAWCAHYNKKIPAEWTGWDAVIDIERAGEEGVQLSQVFKDAASCHPLWGVAEALYTSQLLDREQLAIVLTRRLPGGLKDKAVEIQRKMGLPQSVVEEAYALRVGMATDTLAQQTKQMLGQRFGPIEIGGFRGSY